MATPSSGCDRRELTHFGLRRGIVSPSSLATPGASTLNGGDLNMPGWTIEVLRDMVDYGGKGKRGVTALFACTLLSIKAI